jgi:copper chaperone
MQYTFIVTGMTCGHCEKAVRNALQDADENIQVLTVDRTANRVVVDSELPRAALMQAIADEGYAVEALDAA